MSEVSAALFPRILHKIGMVRRLSQPFSSCEMNEMTMIN